MDVTPDQRAAAIVELGELTHLDAAKRDEIVECAERAPQLLSAILANYQDQDWSDPSTPAGARFLAIVQALGGIAGAVGAVAGAAAGVRGAV